MLHLLKLISEPPVQDWSFAGRAAVHTGRYLGVCSARGVYTTRMSRAPIQVLPAL